MSTRNPGRPIAILLFAAATFDCGRSGPPYGPKDALRTFKIERGFRIESYVTEPDIRSPVAMENSMACHSRSMPSGLDDRLYPRMSRPTAR